MAQSIIAAHGNAAKVNVTATLQLEYSPDSSQVRNVSTGKSNNQVFFNLPSPERSTPNLKSVSVDLTTQTVIVTRIILHLGGDEVLNKAIKKGESFTVPIPAQASVTYAGAGICVALEMEMPGTSKIDFRSVSINCEGL